MRDGLGLKEWGWVRREVGGGTRQPEWSPRQFWPLGVNSLPVAVGERESEGQDCDTHTSHNDKPLLTTSYYPDNIFLAHLPSPVSDIRSGASPVSWWKNATLPNHSPPPVNGAVEHQESLLFHPPLLLLSQPPRPPQFWFQSGGGEGRERPGDNNCWALKWNLWQHRRRGQAARWPAPLTPAFGVF